MTTLLHLSDTHFGTERADVMEALVRFTHEQRPNVVVLSGDITQRARRAQFAAARHFLDRLAAPATLVIPGNHDIPLFNLPARLLRPYGNYQRAFGTELEPSHETHDLLVICVNTTRARRHKDGELSEQQVARVAQRLRAARSEQLRVVVTHQPVHVTRLEDEENLLHGHREAVLAWAEAGADLMLGGHIHLPYVRPLADSVAGLARPLWCLQAGTAVSHRVRGGIPNSVNLVRYAPTVRSGACIVERWDHAASTRRFERESRLEIPLSRGDTPAGRP
ncbi:metallophosphoesterase [Schlegelella sp. S2-27]|uniref:Metallophosphoesterase n=1 Tax=Caldimonas mangrovi TaxID=2944811 RepID=A0ABT0YHB7_9BURK|nr:metallophosphoesterase [Caldimonas mangrovi]MCM5678128.1 metallophosphoesterase [Caldimonas mangrovi]